jgi:O-antigen ligase
MLTFQPARSLPAPALARPRAAVAPCWAGFVLFMVANFLLIVRPTELVPALLGLELYQATILLCLAASFPVVVEQLQPRRLEREPLTVCLLGLNVAIVLSLLAHFQLGLAVEHGFNYAKVVLYFLLFRGLVCDVERLRTFLWWLPLFIALSLSVTLLGFYGVVTLPVETRLVDGEFIRLRSTGLFNDPNDLCVLLAVGIILSLYWLTDTRSGMFRIVWLPLLLLMAFGLRLTLSRGGLLALLAGLAILFRARFGWRLALLFGVLFLPLIVLFAGGRQASLSAGATTSQLRLQLWSEGLVRTRETPLFGLGSTQFEEKAGQVAHNTYIQAFADLGLFGATFFCGSFLFVACRLEQLSRDRRVILDGQLQRLHPFLTGAIGCYMAGMFSLTLLTVLPTAMVLALAATFIRLARSVPPMPPDRFDGRFLFRLAGSSVLLLLALMLFVRLVLVRG